MPFHDTPDTFLGFASQAPRRLSRQLVDPKTGRTTFEAIPGSNRPFGLEGQPGLPPGQRFTLKGLLRLSQAVKNLPPDLQRQVFAGQGIVPTEEQSAFRKAMALERAKAAFRAKEDIPSELLEKVGSEEFDTALGRAGEKLSAKNALALKKLHLKTREVEGKAGKTKLTSTAEKAVELEQLLGRPLTEPEVLQLFTPSFLTTPEGLRTQQEARTQRAKGEAPRTISPGAIFRGERATESRREEQPATRARRGEGLEGAPDPAQHRGRTIRDTVTGQRFRSDGQKWVAIE